MPGNKNSGRKASPRELATLTGADQKNPARYKDRTDNSLLAFPPDTEYLEPTVKLGKEARRGWDMTIPVLLKVRILSPADIVLLEKAFQSLDECNKMLDAIHKFDKDIKKRGIEIWQVAETRNKMMSSYLRNLTACQKIFASFGLTPSDRAHFNLKPDEPKKPQDPLDIILQG